MLIGLLLAGQHTSSTTSAWMGFFLARDRDMQDRCYAEQKAVCGEGLPPLHLDQVGRRRRRRGRGSLPLPGFRWGSRVRGQGSGLTD